MQILHLLITLYAASASAQCASDESTYFSGNPWSAVGVPGDCASAIPALAAGPPPSTAAVICSATPNDIFSTSGWAPASGATSPISASCCTACAALASPPPPTCALESTLFTGGSVLGLSAAGCATSIPEILSTASITQSQLCGMDMNTAASSFGWTPPAVAGNATLLALTIADFCCTTCAAPAAPAAPAYDATNCSGGDTENLFRGSSQTIDAQRAWNCNMGVDFLAQYFYRPQAAQAGEAPHAYTCRQTFADLMSWGVNVINLPPGVDSSMPLAYACCEKCTQAFVPAAPPTPPMAPNPPLLPGTPGCHDSNVTLASYTGAIPLCSHLPTMAETNGESVSFFCAIPLSAFFTPATPLAPEHAAYADRPISASCECSCASFARLGLRAGDPGGPPRALPPKNQLSLMRRSMVGEHIVIGLEQYSQKPIYYYHPNGSPTTGAVDSQFTGFVPDLIDTFAAEMGFTYEFRALPSTGIEYALQGPMGALFPEMMRSSFPAPGGSVNVSIINMVDKVRGCNTVPVDPRQH